MGYVAEGAGPDVVTMCSSTSSPASPQSGGIAFMGSMRIVAGGTYSSAWSSSTTMRSVCSRSSGSGSRVSPAVRHDFYVPDCASGGCTGNVSLPDAVTADTEDNEYALRQQKLVDNAVVVGPVSSK